ncbi:hypothetical protein GCM10023149_09830 [Mucilaginibacter gynuensis]|uniref:Uncharacterized protein n=1 Tax=Mucilaginibacter gynuensis TaxID=1302236 RepID=A0ABP8FYY0_9SPHI
MPYTLITHATSAAAHKIKNALTGKQVILGDYKDLPDFMLKPGAMIKLPDPQAASYAHLMLTLCLDNDIEALYPLKQEEMLLLKEAELLFNEYNIYILTPANEI